MKLELTPKERILNALRGEETDRIPWCPFLAYYWESLPKEVRNKGQLVYLQEMKADPLLRGSHQLFETHYKNCNISNKQNGEKRFVQYETPVGTLKMTYSYAESANSWFLTGHPVETEEDFKILQYIYEKMEITENLEGFETDVKQVKDNALFLPLLGVCMKTPFQALLEQWCGTENLIYALYDFPETVEECLNTMMEKDMKTAEISVESSAEALLFYEDSSTTNISPALFEKYTLPMVNAWGKLLHKNGKILIHHACGHIRDLLPVMNRSEADVIESISPPPTGNIDISEAFDLLGQEKALIGGIEPTFFLKCTDEELEERVKMLQECAKGRRFVLANSDSCPPGVEYEKFRLISNLVRERI